MRFLRRRTATKPAPAPPRPDPARIAVLEHDLLGIAPQPGTAAAALVARRHCTDVHHPLDITPLGGPPTALCARCGRHMVPDEQGRWRIA